MMRVQREDLLRSFEAAYTTMRWKVTSQLLRAFSGALPGQKPGKARAIPCPWDAVEGGCIYPSLSVYPNRPLIDLKDLESGRELSKVAHVCFCSANIS